MPKSTLILASSSPRRLSLLASVSIIPASVVAADIDETPHFQEKPRSLAQRLALEKLRKVAAHHPDVFVLAADTVVAVGHRILPKASNESEIRQCLRLMSGRRHHVYTGVALQSPQGKIFQRMSDSTVIFRRLVDEDIDAYVACGEGIGKAGGYGLQGAAQSFIKYLAGSHSGIIGLPLFEVSQMLKSSGWVSR